ncbi:hypothetical protein D1B33_07785 [Lysinibacillus yapensis]|uniref:Vanomycin resistance protein VanB n=1 Tax=Ureibacillus yapensis TaxID=2304605 RepID=A0A396SD86_9BACL|nr:hypothetical protein D1B33_07785 [Lysinibacillus yapensis]
MLMIIVLMFSILFANKAGMVHGSLDKPFEKENNADNAISIINPFTKKEMDTITPDEFQLETDIVLYTKELEALVHQAAKGFKIPMILDKIDKNGSIIEGRPLITADEPALVEKIIEHTFTGGEIELPLKYTGSGYDEKDIPYLNEVVLSSYTTYFNGHHAGRSKNIELSSLAINQVIVGHNDIFSFNLMVGPREVATGYQMAPEIVNGKMVMGIGGGICQTSSTLFNAVDRLGVQILERHHHSKEVGYVPKGRDATVSFGGLDFKFKNTTGIPFIVKTYYQLGSITIQIKTSKEYEQILKNELTYKKAQDVSFFFAY